MRIAEGTHYAVAEAFCLETLIDGVDELIDEGWTVAGGIAVSHQPEDADVEGETLYVQAMVRREVPA